MPFIKHNRIEDMPKIESGNAYPCPKCGSSSNVISWKLNDTRSIVNECAKCGHTWVSGKDGKSSTI